MIVYKEISADAEIFILTSPGYFLSDEISCVKAKALKKVPAAALTQLILIRIVLIKRSKDRSVQCTQIKRVLLSLFVFQ